jgi:hypothetical protein
VVKYRAVSSVPMPLRRPRDAVASALLEMEDWLVLATEGFESLDAREEYSEPKRDLLRISMCGLHDG